MACINPDGTLTRTARALLRTIDAPRSPEEIAKGIGEPLFKVRSSLREMGRAGLLRGEQGRYVITDRGREALTLDA